MIIVSGESKSAQAVGDCIHMTYFHRGSKAKVGPPSLLECFVCESSFQLLSENCVSMVFQSKDLSVAEAFVRSQSSTLGRMSQRRRDIEPTSRYTTWSLSRTAVSSRVKK